MPIKPDIVTIDHLHFIKKKDTKSPTESIDDMMSQLQSMSKKINLPVVIISHLRKLNADRPPELDDLRDSSSLSQIPSVIMLLHRKKSQNMEFGDTFLEKEGRLYIAKNRLADRTGSVFFRLEDSGNFTIGNSYEKPRAEDKINYYKKDAPQKIKIPTIYD
jgi:replicative DNA helicase